jgi:hypothetical protein
MKSEDFIFGVHMLVSRIHGVSSHPPLLISRCSPQPPPISTSRESVLPIWLSSAQSRRLQPDTQATPFAHSTLNSYLSVMLTLATITKRRHQ